MNFKIIRKTCRCFLDVSVAHLFQHNFPLSPQQSKFTKTKLNSVIIKSREPKGAHSKTHWQANKHFVGAAAAHTL